MASKLMLKVLESESYLLSFGGIQVSNWDYVTAQEAQLEVPWIISLLLPENQGFSNCLGSNLAWVVIIRANLNEYMFVCDLCF